MQPIDILLILWALFGHAALWIGLLNRSHAVGIGRRLVNVATIVGLVMLPLVPVAAAVAYWAGDLRWPISRLAIDGPRWPLFYLIPCWCFAIVAFVRWSWRRLFIRQSHLLHANHTVAVDVARLLGRRTVRGFVGRTLDSIPGNQSLSIWQHDKTLELPRLDPALDGLSILHLSDFHLNGRIEPAYFQQVVALAVEMEPDLIALTGDFVNHAADIDSVAAAICGLRARLGVYFILGNHDAHTGQAPRLRRVLTECGFVDMGGRWQTLEIAGRTVLLAGNELPWLSPAADLSDCPAAHSEPGAPRALRVLLAHTPDAWPYAVRNDFDLMLAGHTHGGQVCIPWIGPLFCPSRHGVALAAGVFQKRPTLLHVTRGLSGEVPLRWNCAPEAAKLILRSRLTS